MDWKAHGDLFVKFDGVLGVPAFHEDGNVGAFELHLPGEYRDEVVPLGVNGVTVGHSRRLFRYAVFGPDGVEDELRGLDAESLEVLKNVGASLSKVAVDELNRRGVEAAKRFG